MLSRLLSKNLDVEVTADACWALVYICDGNVGKIEAAFEEGRITDSLVELIKYVLLPFFFSSILIYHPVINDITAILTIQYVHLSCECIVSYLVMINIDRCSLPLPLLVPIFV